MDTGHLTITIEPDSGSCTIRAVGELDLDSVPAASAYVIRQIESAPGLAWLFDLSGLEFVDSSGLHLLVTMQRGIRAGNGSLTLLDASPNLRRVLTLAGLDGHFEILSSTLPDEALDHTTVATRTGVE